MVGRSALATALIAAAGFAASAQPAPDPFGVDPGEPDEANAIRGTVRDRATGLPLAGVSVSLAGTGEVAVTDDRGRFELLAPGPGTYEVIVVDPSVRRAAARVVVGADGALAQPDLVVESLRPRPAEVVVVERAPRRRTAPGQVSLRRDELTRVPGARDDALQAVKSLPGVAKTEPFGLDAGLVIRGAPATDSRVFVDGFEVPILRHFIGLQSVIPAEMIDELVVTPGGFGVELGKASAGVIELETRDGARTYGGFGEVSFVNAGAQAWGPIGDTASFALGVRRSYLDALIPTFVSGDDLTFTTLPRYYDYQTRVAWTPTDRWKISAFGFGSDDKLELEAAIDELVAVDPAIGTRLAAASSFTHGILAATYDDGRFRNRLSGRIGTRLDDHVVAAQLDEIEIELDPQRYERHVRVARRDAGVRDEARLELGERIALLGGGELSTRWVDVSVHFPRPPHEGDPYDVSFIDDPMIETEQRYTATDSAGWAALETRPIARLAITGGVRVDHFGRNDATVVQPRGNARFAVDRGAALRAAAGLYTRAPDDADENLQTDDLGPERALQVSVGLETKVRHGLELTATAFYTDRSDLIVFAGGDRRTAPAGDGTATYRNAGTGTSYGVEARLAVRDDRFFGWIAYTFSRSTRRDHPGDEVRPFDLDQMHDLVVLGSYRLGKWQLGGRLQYVTGTPYSPVVGATFVSDTNSYEPTFGGINSMRNGAEHQLDLRVDRFFAFERWTLSVYLDIANVYLNAPTIGHDYSYDYSEREETTGLPIVPSFGIRGTL